MLSDKGTNIFSEIGKFFKENDAMSAMNAKKRDCLFYLSFIADGKI